MAINNFTLEENSKTKLNSQANACSEMIKTAKFPSQKKETNLGKYRPKLPELPQGTISKHIHSSKTL